MFYIPGNEEKNGPQMIELYINKQQQTKTKSHEKFNLIPA